MTNENTTATPKIALVTGGSRGIGRNTVVSLAKRGVHTIFTYHSHCADAETVVAEVKDAGAKAVPLHLDSGDVASFDAFVDSVKDALAKLGAPRFDFLVNNAGNNHRNMPFEKATEEEFDSVLSVHFKGVIFFDAEASPADQGWRAHRQHLDCEDSHCLDRRGRLRVDEGRGRSALEASGKGVGPAQDRRQCGCTWPRRNRFQRRHRSRQSCRQQDDCRKYSTRPGRSPRRSRPYDRVASLGRKSLGQCAAYRGRRRSRNLALRFSHER
jgi:hypothetical protein